VPDSRTDSEILSAIDSIAQDMRLRIAVSAAKPKSQGVLTAGEAFVLDSLWRKGITAVGELIAAFPVTRSALSQVIRRLERRGLVKSATRLDDKRYRTLGLTQHGRQLANEIRTHREERYRVVLLCIDKEEDRKEFLRLLMLIGIGLGVKAMGVPDPGQGREDTLPASKGRTCPALKHNRRGKETADG